MAKIELKADTASQGNRIYGTAKGGTILVAAPLRLVTHISGLTLLPMRVLGHLSMVPLVAVS